MVKGVNRSVIEISNTQDSTIERAILFINPDKASRSQAQLSAQAAAFLQAADGELRGVRLPKKQRRSGRILPILSFLAGAAVMCGVFLWFF